MAVTRVKRLGGDVYIDGNLYPAQANAYAIGSTTSYFQNLYDANAYVNRLGELTTDGDISSPTDDTVYIGKKSYGYQGLVVKDTANGHWYAIRVTNAAVALTDLGV